ncbi:hypothetical protein [Streptomyces sp. NPDC050263]|uniref:hypothetical protein n=1 Tax=Streptomyces sp. NPDC050263 TaxID=3155037 RepID=UPI00342F299E
MKVLLGIDDAYAAKYDAHVCDMAVPAAEIEAARRVDRSTPPGRVRRPTDRPGPDGMRRRLAELDGELTVTSSLATAPVPSSAFPATPGAL